MAKSGDEKLWAVGDNPGVISLLTFLRKEGQKTEARHQQFMAELWNLLTQFKTKIVSKVWNQPQIQPNPALNYHPPPVTTTLNPPMSMPTPSYLVTASLTSPQPHTWSQAIDFQQTNTFWGFHPRKTFSTPFCKRPNNTQVLNKPQMAKTKFPQFTPTTNQVKPLEYSNFGAKFKSIEGILVSYLLIPRNGWNS